MPDLARLAGGASSGGMGLLIKGGEVVGDGIRGFFDILCEGERIVALGRDLPVPAGCEVIDAEGKYVFPGFIDPHTHIYLPFMGTFAKDDYASGTKAALIGGTTTVFDMCCPSQAEDADAGYRTWRGQAEGRACCDYSLHMGVTRFDEGTARALRGIVADGVRSFKVFLAYKGALGIDDAGLFRTLELARELDVITTAHCENETLVDGLQQGLLARGETGPGAHHGSRPPFVEAAGVHHLTSFAEATGSRVYIVHLSCREALDEALRARTRGVSVRIETLVQYLVLDKTHAERADFEGAKYVMSPPLRDVSNQEVLWNGLRQGFIDTVGTDHAPFDFSGQKDMGRGDFTKIPNGIPAIEDRINLLYTRGVKGGKITLEDLVRVASTNPAKIFGLHPRKGTIQVGSDADLVVYDPTFRGTLSVIRQMMHVDYNAFEGMEIEGRPGVVVLRGEVAVRDGEFVGTPGRGQFLRR
jgi:dihydropyrimidinase